MLLSIKGKNLMPKIKGVPAKDGSGPHGRMNKKATRKCPK